MCGVDVLIVEPGRGTRQSDVRNLDQGKWWNWSCASPDTAAASPNTAAGCASQRDGQARGPGRCTRLWVARAMCS